MSEISLDEISLNNKTNLDPLLSIIIPAYNVEDYIKDAIISALDQSMKEIEVIVINDGSTDNTKEIIQSIINERNDPRLRVIDQCNRGLSGARNTGVINARGEYIGFLDGDDIWHRDKAIQHCQLLNNNENIGLTFSLSEYLTEDGCQTGNLLSCTKTRPSLHDMIKRNHIGNGSSPVVRMNCFKVAGNFDEDLRSCEDYEMWCRILCLTEYEAILIPRGLTYYRIRNTSLSFDVNNFLINAYMAVNKMRSLMPNIPSHIFSRAIAEHRRIAAWKAICSGKQETAVNILIQIFKDHPQIILTDEKALLTFFIAILPSYLREIVMSLYNKPNNEALKIM